VEEAVSRAVRSTFWPPGEAQRLGDAITDALEVGRWQQAILAVEELLEYEARQWAEAEGRQTSEILATFLYLRGVQVTRYRAFLQALVAVRAGRSVTRSAALSAFVMALEVLW
jgi:hypothetical protein